MQIKHKTKKPKCKFNKSKFWILRKASCAPLVLKIRHTYIPQALRLIVLELESNRFIFGTNKRANQRTEKGDSGCGCPTKNIKETKWKWHIQDKYTTYKQKTNFEKINKGFNPNPQNTNMFFFLQNRLTSWGWAGPS